MAIPIVKNVPKPAGAKSSAPGTKYPLGEMEIGDAFFVSYQDMQEADTPQKFRNRIHQSSKNFALRTKEGDSRKQFTVVLMDADDTEEPKRFFQGDVGVWRDA